MACKHPFGLWIIPGVQPMLVFQLMSVSYVKLSLSIFLLWGSWIFSASCYSAKLCSVICHMCKTKCHGSFTRYVCMCWRKSQKDFTLYLEDRGVSRLMCMLYIYGPIWSSFRASTVWKHFFVVVNCWLDVELRNYFFGASFRCCSWSINVAYLCFLLDLLWCFFRCVSCVSMLQILCVLLYWVLSIVVLWWSVQALWPRPSNSASQDSRLNSGQLPELMNAAPPLDCVLRCATGLTAVWSEVAKKWWAEHYALLTLWLLYLII